MLTLNPLYQQCRLILQLLRIVLGIQTKEPTEEESALLINGFRELNISPSTYKDNALLCLQISLKRTVDDLEASYYELSQSSGFVPKSLDSALQELLEGMKEEGHKSLSQFVKAGGINDAALRSLFTPLPEEELVSSAYYNAFKDCYQEATKRLRELLDDDIDYNDLPRIEECLNELILAEYVLTYFERVDYDILTEEEMKYSEVKVHLDQIEESVIEGIESYLNELNLQSVEGSEGFMDTVKAGITKTVEAIKTAFKTLFDFFTGRKKDAATQVSELKAKFTKQLDDLKAAGNNSLVVDKEKIEKTISMLEKADLSEVAAHFKGVEDPAGAIGAYTAAISDLEKLVKPDDGDKALSDTQSKLNDLSSTSVDVQDDAPAEEKSTLKEVIAEKTKSLKESFANAKESVQGFLKPLSAMERLTATMQSVIKKKSEKEEVSGNEAWMY